MRFRLLNLLLVTVALLPQQAFSQTFQDDVDWAINNRTGPEHLDCADQYVPNGVPECVLGGGRACVMERAIGAISGGCTWPTQLVLLTQCAGSQGPARARLQAAINANLLCPYLRTKVPAPPVPGPPPAPPPPPPPPTAGRFAVTFAGVRGSSFVVETVNTTPQEYACTISFTLDYDDISSGGRSSETLENRPFDSLPKKGGGFLYSTDYAASTLKARGVTYHCTAVSSGPRK